ncbi:MAG TPA: hypothetical protein PLJ62_04980 [Thermoflexales bacterium]|nr:hypothetical protein [Thermoflexales bacterium]HQW36096.1 hypothetical protein [Thermoflexales bacterium]HQZ99532.1 hypothetical protein [Thermoflexales bacterium]
MPNYICLTCGTQYPESETPPAACPICQDERQYVGWGGQQWATLSELQTKHKNEFRPQGEGITGIGSSPKIAIGQRALLVQTAEGNLLWDCVSLIDDETAQKVKNLGGLRAIAISHPHFYSSMVAWSRAFGGVPIYLHEDNRAWVMRPAPEIVFWQSETLALFGGLTLIRCGGHFDGSTVAHWQAAERGAGAIFTGDTINVAQDRRWLSFMKSFPNDIPLPARAVRHIAASVEPFAFDKIYGGWWDAIVSEDGKAAVKRSAERYIRAITD